MENLLEPEFWSGFWVGVAEEVIADGVKILVLGFFALVGALLWRFRRAARKRNFIELWKRIKNDEYFADRRRQGLILLVTTLAFGIGALQLYTLGRAGNPSSMMLALMMVLAEYGILGSLVIEDRYYKKALDFRMRIERRRRILEKQRERKRATRRARSEARQNTLRPHQQGRPGVEGQP